MQAKINQFQRALSLQYLQLREKMFRMGFQRHKRRLRVKKAVCKERILVHSEHLI